MAALLAAAGAGGVGYLGGRADLAAVGAAMGVLGIGLEQAASRAGRRHLRQDRARMRADLRSLELTVENLRRELAAAPSVLRPEPPPTPTTGPLPLVGASGRAAAPATPRSLPILTANRRGLQSLTPALLPGQRPPATPITGLRLPPVANPALTVLAPGPVVDLRAIADAFILTLEDQPTQPIVPVSPFFTPGAFGRGGVAQPPARASNSSNAIR